MDIASPHQLGKMDYRITDVKNPYVSTMAKNSGNEEATT
jgi:hypothetical protein